MVMVRTLVTWRTRGRASEPTRQEAKVTVRRLQGTHPSLPADLQAVLQAQLVVLGGDDRPVGGNRDTPQSTTTAAGDVRDLK